MECGGELRFQTAIEIGHIFKLGTRYSVPLGATFLDEDGQEKPLVMGSYGDRARARDGCGGRAEPRRQRHPLAGGRSHRTMCTWSRCRGWSNRPRRLRCSLPAAGADVLLDDRDLRAGEKFADADLIGLPVRVTVGRKTLEDGKVDVRQRASGAEERVDIADLGKEAFNDGETA